MRRLSSLAAALALVAAGAFAGPASAAGDKLVIELKTGKVVIKLRPDLAPKHVAQYSALASQGFYDGVKWHRVIEGFMAQTGDPTGTGSGGSKLPHIPAEFTKEPYKRGTVGAARTMDPNTANSQFFICFDDATFLDKQYTVWGKVIEGMDNVDKLARGEPPRSPDKMISVRVAADA